MTVVRWGLLSTANINRLVREGARLADGAVAPVGATFEDGYRCALVCDAILRSSQSGREETV